MTARRSPTGYAGSQYDGIDDALEDLQVDEPDAFGLGREDAMPGWYALSSGHAGVVAYTRSGSLIYGLRLHLINMIFNGGERGTDLVSGRAPKAPAPYRDLHTFAPVAPEVGDPDAAVTWEWCIRCGVMRLAGRYFRPGRHQRKTMHGEVEIPPCLPIEIPKGTK